MSKSPTSTTILLVHTIHDDNFASDSATFQRFRSAMPPIPPLFTLPIQPNGRITCTQPSPRIYLLTFEAPPDNRLIPSFCSSLLLALDILDHRFPKGVVVTTSGIQKFYSNGLDYESAVKEGERFWSGSLYPLWRRLLT